MDMHSVRAEPAVLGTFERYLTLWVALCIIVGMDLATSLRARSGSSPDSRSRT